MTPAELADGARLDREIAAFGTLRDILRQEQETLRRVDPDALADLVPRKLAAVSAVARMTRERGEALRAADVDTTLPLVARWLGGPPPDAATEKRARDLIALVQETFTLNSINQRLAQGQARYFDRAADALRRAAGQDVVYGADGHTAHHPASRTLAAGV